MAITCELQVGVCALCLLVLAQSETNCLAQVALDPPAHERPGKYPDCCFGNRTRNLSSQGAKTLAINTSSGIGCGPRSKALVRRFAPLAPKQNAAVLSTTNIAEQSCCVLRSTHTKRNFTSCEMIDLRTLEKEMNKENRQT